MIKNRAEGNFFYALSREPLREKVYQALKNDILALGLPPGREFTIEELAVRYGVSPTPIRDAVTRLVAEGLVEAPPNRSARVSPIRVQEISESFLVRRCVESHMIAIAAESIGHDDALKEKVADLVATCERFLSASADRQSPPEDLAEYASIADGIREIERQSVGEGLLTRMLNVLTDQSRRTRMLPESDQDEGVAVTRRATREHLDILKAVATGDSQAAVDATCTHLRNAERRTLSSVTKCKDHGASETTAARRNPDART